MKLLRGSPFCIFLILAAGSACALDPTGTGTAALADLLGKERRLDYKVSLDSESGAKSWIYMKAVYETAYPSDLESATRLLLDFENGPRVFSRIEKVRLRSNDGVVAVSEQTSAIRAFGIAFISKLVFRIRVARPQAGRVVIDFATIETDATVKSASGTWDLEAFESGGKPCVRLVYTLENYSAPNFPGQEYIMRVFGGAEIEKNLRELGTALEKEKHIKG